MMTDVESKAHDIESTMSALIPNLLRVLAGGGDIARLRDQLAETGTRVIETNKAQMDGLRDGTVNICSPLDINAIGAAVNKFFDHEHQREMRDKTGIARAENRVVQQALRVAAGNGNNGELWTAIRYFNEAMKEVHPHWQAT